jgi:hypothetical protein
MVAEASPLVMRQMKSEAAAGADRLARHDAPLIALALQSGQR